MDVLFWFAKCSCYVLEVLVGFLLVATGSEEASMRRSSRVGSWVEIIAVLFGCVLIASQAVAQDARQNEPGKFDFYLLALSWSPSFCVDAGERNSSSKSVQHCRYSPVQYDNDEGKTLSI